MELITPRLILKEYTSGNLYDYYRLKSCKAVWKYSTFCPLENINETEKLLEDLLFSWRKNKKGFMALFTREDSRYIGEAGILAENKIANRCEIGYNLLPEYWNRGFATEISQKLVRYAIEEMGYERVEALVLAENKASSRVLEKSDFRCEGTLRHFSKCGGEYCDVKYYGLISSDIYRAN
ncbi:GNAT family N-acetyltransferase [Hungatella hathewayi]